MFIIYIDIVFKKEKKQRFVNESYIIFGTNKRSTTRQFKRAQPVCSDDLIDDRVSSRINTK